VERVIETKESHRRFDKVVEADMSARVKSCEVEGRDDIRKGGSMKRPGGGKNH